MASKKHGTLYIGFTGDLVARAWQHREKAADGFTKTYRVMKLVHYEIFSDPASAIHREKSLKKWRREWKIELIEEHNPEWRDLYDEITK